MHITYATYLAAIALSTAQAEVAQGLTNLHHLEHAAIVYVREEFQAEVFQNWLNIAQGEGVVALNEMDEEFEDFIKSLDAEDLKFITPAIIA